MEEFERAASGNRRCEALNRLGRCRAPRPLTVSVNAGDSRASEPRLRRACRMGSRRGRRSNPLGLSSRCWNPSPPMPATIRSWPRSRHCEARGSARPRRFRRGAGLPACRSGASACGASRSTDPSSSASTTMRNNRRWSAGSSRLGAAWGWRRSRKASKHRNRRPTLRGLGCSVMQGFGIGKPMPLRRHLRLARNPRRDGDPTRRGRAGRRNRRLCARDRNRPRRPGAFHSVRTGTALPKTPLDLCTPLLLNPHDFGPEDMGPSWTTRTAT
jgi:hypothetical protein